MSMPLIFNIICAATVWIMFYFNSKQGKAIASLRIENFELKESLKKWFRLVELVEAEHGRREEARRMAEIMGEDFDLSEGIIKKEHMQ